MIYIKVPNENDSMSKITLDGKIYHLRFTWNDVSKFWSFGVYKDNLEPIVPMTRIVIRTPLLHYYTYSDLPKGDFMAVKLEGEEIGRDDFENQTAGFFFATNEEWGIA